MIRALKSSPFGREQLLQHMLRHLFRVQKVLLGTPSSSILISAPCRSPLSIPAPSPLFALIVPFLALRSQAFVLARCYTPSPMRRLHLHNSTIHHLTSAINYTVHIARQILKRECRLQKGKVPGRSSRKQLPQGGAEQNTRVCGGRGACCVFGSNSKYNSQALGRFRRHYHSLTKCDASGI